MFEMMDSLENRQFFAVDVSLSFAPLMTEIPRYVDPGVVTKCNVALVVGKSAGTLAKGQKPADIRLVLRPAGGGADVLIGTIKGSVITGIKNGGKLVKAAVAIPKTAPQGDYNLTATFDGTSIGDPEPTNNTSIFFNTVTTITANPPSPMSAYGLASRFTFKKTGKGEANGVGGTVHELGNVVDATGKAGTYELIVQNPRIPLPGSLDFTFDNHTEEFFMTFTKRQTSLNGKTLEFTAAQTKDSIGTVYQLNEGVIYFRIKK